MKKKKVVLVTGASTGIGLATIKKLEKQEYITVATARKTSLNRFNEVGITEKESLLIRPLDITSGDDRTRLVEELNKNYNGVDILINNAGESYRSTIEDTDDEDEMHQFNTNYFGPMRLIRLVLPKMREKEDGYIINISSVSGLMAMPTMGNYSASKFALEGATESLWYEMKPWGIKVCAIQPGFVKSDAFEKVLLTKKSQQSIENLKSPYNHYYREMSRFISKIMQSSFATPDTIANKIIKVINDPDPYLRIPATLDAWIFYALRRTLPRWIYHRIIFKALPNIKSWKPDD